MPSARLGRRRHARGRRRRRSGDIALFPGGAARRLGWDRLRVPDAEPIRSDRAPSSASTSTTRRCVEPGRRQGPPGDARSRPGDRVGRRRCTPRSASSPRPDRARPFAQTCRCQDGCYVTGDLGQHPARRDHQRAGSRCATSTTKPGGDVVPLGPGRAVDAVRRPGQGVHEAVLDAPRRAHRHGATARASTEIRCSSAGCRPSVPALVAGPLPTTASTTGSRASGSTARTRPPLRVGALPPGARRRGPDTVVAEPRRRRARPLGRADRQLELWFADDDPALLARVTEALTEHGIAVSATSTLADMRRGLRRVGGRLEPPAGRTGRCRRAADRPAGAGRERGQRLAVPHPRPGGAADERRPATLGPVDGGRRPAPGGAGRRSSPARLAGSRRRPAGDADRAALRHGARGVDARPRHRLGGP